MANHAEPALEKTKDKLPRLHKLAHGKKNLLIIIQDNPDPDALAAAAALRLVLRSFSELRTTVAYGGMIARPENRTLADGLELPLHSFREVELSSFDLVALVDTQPQTGNNPLPPDAQADIVIDHHPFNQEAGLASYSDIRSDYGATSTILYEYLRELDIPPDPLTAAALVYGIRTDTQGLTRDATPADVAAYSTLFPVASKRFLSRIEHSPVPRSYFGLLLHSVERATIHGPAVLSVLESVPDQWIIPHVAELLLRLEGIDYAVCIGALRNEIFFSVRSLTEDAASLAKAIAEPDGSAGGHSSMAAGKISASSSAEIPKLLKAAVSRLRKAVGCKSRPRKLVTGKDLRG